MYMDYVVNVLGFFFFLYGGAELYGVGCFTLGDGCADGDGGVNTGGCGRRGCVERLRYWKGGV